MINTMIGLSKISFTFSSDKQTVNHILGMAEHFVIHNTSSNVQDFSIVLRELLNNAVEHGSRSDGEKNISCSIELSSNNKAVIIVEDSGHGFDYSQLDLSLPTDALQIQHRGLILVNALSDRVEFNDCGNRVTVIVTMKERE